MHVQKDEFEGLELLRYIADTQFTQNYKNMRDRFLILCISEKHF